MSRNSSDKRPTLKDLAREAGVSLASASYAVNGTGSVGEQTRAHILEVAQRIGYRQNLAARVMKTGRSGNLALVLPDLTNPFFPTLAQALFRSARARGYGMFLIDTEGNEELEHSALSRVSDIGVDGLVWFPIRDKDTSQGVLKHMPAVVLDRTVPGFAAVGVDYHDAGRLAARHLLDMGHRRIGIISGPGDVASMRDRCDGAQALIAAEGELAFRVENAFSVDLEPPVIDALLHSDATAIFAAADVIAIGVLRHAQARGLQIPRDLSVLGFDDIPLADQQIPPLSTIELPVETIATTAVEALLAQLEADGPKTLPAMPLVTTNLVERRTVAAPSDGAGSSTEHPASRP
ncbi:LacI family DNA-binding transcriptional regulator [Croceibacterium xixiisoli]|nr:LacI family DNA-binding transcriptional regulator [Croceibacterium xixiisoli]